ncbi:MAG: rhodanese-like domain-containing protein [Chromatiales bacterium]|jgi:rhodanese-related sulfurtransferase
MHEMTVFKRLNELFWWLPFGRVPEVGVAELNGILTQGPKPQIVDVRSGAEWRKSRIPGAVNVPIQELRRRLDSLSLDAERPIVAICLSAHRSIPAVRLLRARGFPHAVQLQGGMLAWWKAEYATEGDSDAV